MKAVTASSSKTRPAPAVRVSIAVECDRAARYGRLDVSASYTSATVMMRAPIGISSPTSPSRRGSGR